MARLRRPATPTPPPDLPLDVRLMNGVASAVFVLAALALVAVCALWLARLPVFTIRGIQIDGDVSRNSLNTIRANAVPGLAGNFFSLDLQRGQAAFESVPWVRQAVVRRIWPDRLAVRLQEHRPAAVWLGDEGNDRLVNTHGEVFEANLGDVEEDGLPGLRGPEGTSAQMLAMVQRLQPLLAGMALQLETLQLSNRGSWRVALHTGAALELGRGSVDEVLARAQRFVRTLAQVTGRYGQPLEYADLRHADGYAVRLRGVTTGPQKNN